MQRTVEIYLKFCKDHQTVDLPENRKKKKKISKKCKVF